MQAPSDEVRTPIRVFHCDDRVAFLTLVQYWLADYPEIALVGSAPTRAEALAGASAARPDVVLLDTMGGDPLGVDRIRAAAPGVRVLVYTGFGPQAAEQLVPGADDYLQKREDERELVEAIHRLGGR